MHEVFGATNFKIKTDAFRQIHKDIYDCHHVAGKQ